VAVEASGSRLLNRHPRRVRLFHAAVYLTTLPLLLTGWWLLLGGEGNPSPLARLFGTGDTRVHVWFGRVLLVVALVPLVAGRKGIVTFVKETFRIDRGDGRWWVRWPAGALTGRFGRHEGRFDPGQRVANVVIVIGLLVLTGTGIALTLLHGGPVFAQLARIHKWTTYIVTPFILGHMLIAFSVLPGYRGVWRSMHLGGRVPEGTARRVWPGWAERSLKRTTSSDTADRPSSASHGRRS
jgi:cytochrome b subunit of formate dehydrogenase